MEQIAEVVTGIDPNVRKARRDVHFASLTAKVDEMKQDLQAVNALKPKAEIKHKMTLADVEKWIVKSLQRCIEEKLGGAGDLLHYQNISPLVSFQIDRISLSDAGVPVVEIDHLYQTLYVHTMGFYNNLK